WRQIDPVGLSLYNALASNTTPTARSVRHYLFINGSRWDLVRENAPFVGTQKMPPGHSLYPTDLTRADVDAYVKAHPAAKAALFYPYPGLHRTASALPPRKSHEGSASSLPAAGEALRKAADLSPDAAFARFLRLRADALLSDDYYPSDVAWVDLENPK